jgi:hypothetical protein
MSHPNLKERVVAKPHPDKVRAAPRPCPLAEAYLQQT